jgi:hypothetical protein
MPLLSVIPLSELVIKSVSMKPAATPETTVPSIEEVRIAACAAHVLKQRMITPLFIKHTLRLPKYRAIAAQTCPQK